MGYGIVGQPSSVEGITSAGPGAKCDVCGRQRDVASVLGVIEGPEHITDGLASLLYICSFCGARIIQATTGFKAVRQLKSWYLVRERHPHLDGDTVQRLAKDDDWIG